MTIIGRTEPRSPIEEQLLQTIARLDARLFKGTDDERQEIDADVIMRTVVAPALAQARRDAIEVGLRRGLELASDETARPGQTVLRLQETLTKIAASPADYLENE